MPQTRLDTVPKPIINDFERRTLILRHTYLNKRAFVRSIRISCLENDEDSNGGYFTWVEPITKSDAITRHATQIQYDTQDDDPDDGQDLDTCKPKLHFPYF